MKELHSATPDFHYDAPSSTESFVGSLVCRDMSHAIWFGESAVVADGVRTQPAFPKANFLYGLAGLPPSVATRLGEEVIRPVLCLRDGGPPRLALSLEHSVGLETLGDEKTLSGFDLTGFLTDFPWRLPVKHPRGSGTFLIRHLGSVPGTRLEAVLLAGVFTAHEFFLPERRFRFAFSAFRTEAMIDFHPLPEDVSGISRGTTPSDVMESLAWPVDREGACVCVRSTLAFETVRLLDERAALHGEPPSPERDSRLQEVVAELDRRCIPSMVAQDETFRRFEAGLSRWLRRKIGPGARLWTPAQAQAARLACDRIMSRLFA